MQETAYAKINLALHVRARRDDGYHELETLSAFVDAGDVLPARSAEQDTLEVVGEFGGASGAAFDNLVTQALGKLPRPGGLAITLDKRLPVAAGLGGGSADAGAVFRIVREMHGLPDDWQDRAAALGADVPACVESVACVGRGTGTDLQPIDNDLAGTPVLLVNPRVAVSTGPVFAAWDGEDRGPLPEGPASVIARNGRNDLEAPAIAQAPAIAAVLEGLRDTPATLVRMSGSGATCFALYATEAERSAAAVAMPREWWTMEGKLR